MNNSSNGLEKWLAKSATLLKGQPVAQAARRPQKGGLEWKVLYTAGDVVGSAHNMLDHPQFGDGSFQLKEPKLTQKYTFGVDTDATQISELLLQDLDGGVSGISICYEDKHNTKGNTPKFDESFWRRVLSGVETDLIAFELPLGATGQHGTTNSTEFLSTIQKFYKKPAGLCAKFSMTRGFVTQFEEFSQVWANFPDLEMLFESSHLHNIGASSPLELACFLAFATEFKRRFPSQAQLLLERFKVRLSVNSNILGSLAKLRAARLLWSRLFPNNSETGSISTLEVYAETSAAELSRYDTWTNILRTSSQCAAALMANCDAATVLPHDMRALQQNPFGHRLARNIFNVLVHESHLARIADPLQGAYAVEAHTAAMCEAAWLCYQEIEAAGGLAAAHQSGWLAGRIQESRKKLIEEECFRKPGTIGVSEFPNANEWVDWLNHECVAMSATTNNQITPPATRSESFNTSEAIQNWCEPLFLSDIFSSLREIVALNWKQATGCEKPLFSLIVVGNQVELSPRISWVENVFGTLGMTHQASIAIVPETLEWQEELRNSLPDKLMPIQILVASDSFYETHLSEFTEIFNRANNPNKPSQAWAAQILVAGRIKAENFERSRQCSLTSALYAGANIYEVLQNCLKKIGVDK